MPSELSLHLTEPDKQLAQWVKDTPAGMAHWSGTGPEFKTCRECVFFDHQKSYYAKKGIGGGRPQTSALQEILPSDAPKRQSSSSFDARLQVFRAGRRRAAGHIEMTSAAKHHGAMTLDRADTREGAYARFPIIQLRGVPLLRSARGLHWYLLPACPETSLPAHRPRWRADGRSILPPLWRAAARYRSHSR